MKIYERQSAWRTSAALNLTLGGMGAGFYIATLLLNLPEGSDWAQTLGQTAVYKLLAPVLVAVGLLSLTVEAGHPLHGIYLLTNLRRSWMSREALVGVIFVILAVVEWFVPSLALRIIASLAGLIFIVTQGMIMWRANSVITWRAPAVPWLFLTCGLSSGTGLMLFFASVLGTSSRMSLPLAGVIIAVLNALVWALYLRTPGQVFQRGVEPLRQRTNVLLTVGVGHALPILLLLIALATPQPALVAVAGLILVFGGAMMKYGFSLKGTAMKSLVRVT